MALRPGDRGLDGLDGDGRLGPGGGDPGWGRGTPRMDAVRILRQNDGKSHDIVLYFMGTYGAKDGFDEMDVFSFPLGFAIPRGCFCFSRPCPLIDIIEQTYLQGFDYCSVRECASYFVNHSNMC